MENEQIEEIREEQIVEVSNTVCEHYFLPTKSDPNSNMLSALCSKCPHGINYEADKAELVDGKLVKKEGPTLPKTGLERD